MTRVERVILTNSEIAMASHVGYMRQLSALWRNLADKHGCDVERRWDFHIEGACGECALAKALGVHWEGTINTFKDGNDVGGVDGFQVRTRSKHWHELIIRPDDRDDDWFVLLTGLCPVYEVRGQCRGRDGKREEWFKNHGEREPAWFVPQKSLGMIF